MLQVTEKLIDDIDGKPAIETVTFGIDGESFEIDLHAANARRLRAVYGPYLAHARKARPAAPERRQGGPKKAAPRNRVDGPRVRAWARATEYQGWNPNNRGRIPATVMQAFDIATAAASNGSPRR